MITSEGLRIDQNRAMNKYPGGILFKRFLWGVVRPLFRFSPRICFGWRRFLLRLFGARIGQEVHIYNSARIYMPWNLEVGDWASIGEEAFLYNLGRICIREKATVSQRAYLCAGTHDYKDPAMPLVFSPIEVGAQAWICTDAFIGPGISVGEGAIVGARAVVTKNVEPWQIVAGNPARPIGKRALEH
ncbi:MAG: putative colanic acid biosynthesis acetyltransferase [Acidobacteriia bacterium]|nr:putative colanic acid biosynthesis acetyltransferase [Terriglobia bacterium]